MLTANVQHNSEYRQQLTTRRAYRCWYADKHRGKQIETIAVTLLAHEVCENETIMKTPQDSERAQS